MSKKTRQSSKIASRRRDGEGTAAPNGRRLPAAPGKKAPSRWPVAAGAAALLVALLIGGGWMWLGGRRAAAVKAPAADAREAQLLRAVQARPRDGKAREELAAHYFTHRQPFPALWELAVAQEVGARDAALPLKMAAALEQGGLPGAALRLLAEDGEGSPAPVLLATARLHLQVGEPDAARDLLRRHPAAAETPEGVWLQAQSALALGDRTAARMAALRYRRHAEKENDAAARVAVGRLLLAAGDRKAALEVLTWAAREHPDHEPAQYHAGLAYAAGKAAGDREKALEYFKQATRADPRAPGAGVEIGRLLYERSGEWEQAVEVYKQALKMAPQYLPAEEGLARAYTALKQRGRATYHQARVMELQARPQEALRLYRRWGELQPERWDAYLRAAECWMDMNRFLEAAQEVRRGLKRFPKEAELFSHLAQILIRTGDRPEAARVCERWAPVDTTTGRPEWVRGQLAAAAQRHEEAIRWHRAAIDRNPEFGIYHAELGQALAREATPERLGQARAALERAAALSPGSGLVHAQLGLVYQQSGDAEAARRSFLRALDREPGRLDAYRGLMAVTRQLGHAGASAFLARIEREVRDQQRAETAAGRALWRQPQSAAARVALARLLLQRGLMAEARHHLAVAAEQADGAAARDLRGRIERLLSVR